MLVLLLLLISRLINRSGLRIFHSKVFSSEVGTFVFWISILILDQDRLLIYRLIHSLSISSYQSKYRLRKQTANQKQGNFPFNQQYTREMADIQILCELKKCLLWISRLIYRGCRYPTQQFPVFIRFELIWSSLSQIWYKSRFILIDYF